MAQTDPDQAMSLALWAENWAERKRAEREPLCPVFSLVSALRLLSSRAVPSARVPRVYHTPLSALVKGDISTLQNRGHFYFALTGVRFCFFLTIE